MERDQLRDGARDGESSVAADPAEHLTRDLARVRAKFGVDPALASRSLAAAWKSETPLEEDEAEFLDAVADCLVAGLSLDDALNCWDNGELAYQASEDGSTDGDADRDDETAPVTLPSPRRPSTAHRVLVR
jgi:hypothetical protein